MERPGERTTEIPNFLDKSVLLLVHLMHGAQIYRVYFKKLTNSEDSSQQTQMSKL